MEFYFSTFTTFDLTKTTWNVILLPMMSNELAKQTAAAEANAATLKPTLRDRARHCSVSHLFGSYFKVTNRENGHTYRVEAVWLDGDVTAICQCFKSKTEVCHHEMAVIMSERSRVAGRQFN